MKKIVTSEPTSERRRAPSAEEAEVLPRRNVLRGALAAGCSLLVPASLLGCDRGQDADSAGGEAPAPASPDTAPPSGDTGRAPDAAAPEAPAASTPQPAKVSQASVQYQNQPKGAQKCGNCIQFIPPNACKVVEGEISPEGWCALWVGQT